MITPNRPERAVNGKSHEALVFALIEPVIPKTGKKVKKPWGYFEVLGKGSGFQVKQIVVNPGESLSLQWHMHRGEIWTVVNGVGLATVDDGVEEIQTHVYPGNVVDIKSQARHRLENPGKIPLVVIEVQLGEYLGEDDVNRLEDLYGREAS